MMLKNKADLRDTEEYKSGPFLDVDRSREEREVRRLNVLKKKSQRSV